MDTHRTDLATKTGERKREEAYAEISIARTASHRSR